MKQPARPNRRARIELREAQDAVARQIEAEWREYRSQQGVQNARRAVSGFKRQTGR